MCQNELVRETLILDIVKLIVSKVKSDLDIETAKLTEEEKNNFNKELLERLETVKEAGENDFPVRYAKKIWKAIKETPFPGDNVFITSDVQDSGEILITAYLQGSAYEIKVLESIRARFQNLFHPLIQWAIERELPKIQIDGHATKEFMRKLPSAMKKGAKHSAELYPLDQYIKLKSAPMDFCATAWAVVQEADIEGGECPDEGSLDWIKEEIEKRLPDQKLEGFFEFLRAGKLPKSKKFDAFSNALNAFLYDKNITPGTYSQTLYLIKKEVGNLGRWPDFSEEGQTESFISDLTAELMDQLFGRSVIINSNQITNSSLKFREITLEERLANLPIDQILE